MYSALTTILHLSASLSGSMLKELDFYSVWLRDGWRAGGVHVVSNRKLEVALRDLLKASLHPANAHGLLKGVIWKGAVPYRFALPAPFHATEMLWLCTAAGFCAVHLQFLSYLH